ncbi:hypothetical protein AB832_04550 [Flavobacteriaceae bacterium (ex Bugula neritina AB1)]|nr:hypothetical protein AB832_04550 [Flavobacteriaceae bacterium (ex Bugula neritina AB1)]
MHSFEFIDLILFLGISQGVFLAITLQIIKNKNKSGNSVLAIILLIAVVMLLGRMMYFKYLNYNRFRWTILIDAVIFLFGPLCYIYLRRLIFLKKDRYFLPWFHYLPLLFHILFFLYVIVLDLETFIAKLSSGFFKIPFMGIEGAGIFLNFYYWYLSFRLIKAYQKEAKNQVSFKQGLVSFLKFFLTSIGVFLSAWVLSFVSLHFFDHSLYPIGYNWVWVGICVFIFVIGYYSLKEPGLFRIEIQPSKVNSPQKRLNEAEINSLAKELKYLIEEEKVFLKTDLTLRDLSEKLHVSTHNISWYLNQISKSNFYDYINRYRVKEFLKKVDNDEHLSQTILALSMDVGFNSKSTFNKAFKLEMNDTPSNYIKKRFAVV